MALSEETLGYKQKCINNALYRMFQENKTLEDINYEDLDTNNFLKIDLACRTRNAEYVLNVFKSEDMLYVCRAMKHSVWLVQEPQYAHLVNPTYLSTELFPYMITEARNKLLLHIRLHLKDPLRNEEFFKYLIEFDHVSALKWLPNCSINFIKSNLLHNIYVISEQILLRLFAKSFEILKMYCEVYKKSPKLQVVQKSLFLIRNYGNEFFDVLDTIDTDCIPQFGKKFTMITMRRYPLRLISNFKRYSQNIDMPTFVKYFPKEHIENFIAENKDNQELVLNITNKFKKNIKSEDFILEKLSSCNFKNQEQVKEKLRQFVDVFSMLHVNVKYKFLNIFMKKAYVERFDKETWIMFNDVFKRMNIKNYSRNKCFHTYIKCVITYKIINNEIIQDDIIAHVKYCLFKKKNFNEEQGIKIFTFLLDYAVLNLNTSTEKIIWVENIRILLKNWNKHLLEYPLIMLEIKNILLKMENKIASEELYKKFNLGALESEQSSKTCMYMLKHDIPRLNEGFPVTKHRETKSYKRLCRKLRSYWPDTLAEQYKNSIVCQSIGFYVLLSKNELLKVIEKLHAENISNSQRFFFHNIHHCEPKPRICQILSHIECFNIHSLSSLNSVLHTMPIKEAEQSLKNLERWPEYLQKLCVWVLYTKPNRMEHRNFIISIWNNTRYTSVRAVIFKKAIKYLQVTTHCKEWKFLEFLLDDLRTDEAFIVRNTIRKVSSFPKFLRSEFCKKAYLFLKAIPLQFDSYSRKPILHYFGGSLHSLDCNLLADIVNDTITVLIWKTRLNKHYLDAISSCLFMSKTDSEQLEDFNKVILPIFLKAYQMWDVTTVNCQMVRFNINNIVTTIRKKYTHSLDSQRNFLPSVLISLLDSLQSNLHIKHNYIMITSLKLAIEYLKILSNSEAVVLHEEIETIVEETAPSLAQTCVDILCQDIAQHGVSIWVLFYHSLKNVIDDFYIKPFSQYKIFNNILDISQELPADLDIFVNILVLELTFYKNFNIISLFCCDYDDSEEDEESRIRLLNRIQTHPSIMVKASHSKIILSHVCDVEYTPIKY